MDDNRVKAAAAAIADQIKAPADNLAAFVHRDRVFLAAVCGELNLEPTVENETRVFTLLAVAGVPTHEEYPKMVYPFGPGRPGVVAQTEQDVPVVTQAAIDAKRAADEKAAADKQAAADAAAIVAEKKAADEAAEQDAVASIKKRGK